MAKQQNRTYLTNAEALSWGEFLHSDYRRLMKHRETKDKYAQGMLDFVPWAQAMRIVTKEDMKIWKELYFDHGITNYNDINPILLITQK